MPPSVHTTSNVAVDPALPRAAPIAGTSVAGRLPAPGADARYTRTAMVLHWLIAALVIVQFGWGWWMQEIPKVPVGPRVDAFNLPSAQYGGDGDDLLKGGTGADTLDGQGGVDTADYRDKSTSVVLTLNGASNATVTVGGRRYPLGA